MKTVTIMQIRDVLEQAIPVCLSSNYDEDSVSAAYFVRVGDEVRAYVLPDYLIEMVDEDLVEEHSLHNEGEVCRFLKERQTETPKYLEQLFQ